MITVIGDVHGCFDTLMALIAKIPPGETIVFAGDLIDRGPKSRQVVDFVKNGGYLCVRGNHEQMAAEEGMARRYGGIWFPNGGDATLKSYEEKAVIEDEPYVDIRRVNEQAFEEHRAWMATLPVYLEFPEVKNSEGRYLVVSHSTLGKVWHHRNLPERKKIFEGHVMWDRSPTQDQPEIYNVVGHTPIENGPKITKCYANVDTGCCFKQEGYGKLTALRYPEMEVIQQENIDR